MRSRIKSTGLFLFSIGLFKKVVIADTFAPWANAGFNTVQTLNMIEAWATSLSYTFQLYFDFSGYTDMALGVALMFNIKLPINFNSPYKALDIQDFWRRWHITLSRFLRDYIYIPLGGNRNGELRTYTNLFSVFLIGGLWHGASWMFIIWGTLHGSAIIIHRAWKSFGLSMNKYLSWFITFNFINITWIFFRAKDWEHAENILNCMFNGLLLLPYIVLDRISSLKNTFHFGDVYFLIEGNDETTFWVLGGFIAVLFFKNSAQTVNIFQPSVGNSLLFLLFSLTGILNLMHVSEFLYFNF